MKRILFFIIISTHSCVISYAESLQLPYLRDVNLKAKVMQDAGGIYTYGYKITNGKDNIGDLTSFDIDISKPANGVSLSNTGLVNAPKHVIGVKVPNMPPHLENFQDKIITSKIVPVGFPSVPVGWLAGPTTMGTAGWGAFKLKPGSSATGFVLQSRGIPTIRDFRAEPVFDTELMKYYPDVETLPEEAVKKVDEQLKKDREAIAFNGKTTEGKTRRKQVDPGKNQKAKRTVVSILPLRRMPCSSTTRSILSISWEEKRKSIKEK